MNDTQSDPTLKITLTKRSGETFEIKISPEDEDLSLLRWSALVGRNGQIYAHRTENKKKIYLARCILEQILKRPLEKGESCYHVNGNSRDKTRGNLSIQKPKKQ